MISRRSALGALAMATGGALVAGEEGKEKPKESAPSYKFGLRKAKAREYDGGSLREHRAADFPASENISAGLVRLAAGAFREPHWHPNSDEWAYILEGKVRLTVVGLHGQAVVEVAIEFGVEGEQPIEPQWQVGPVGLAAEEVRQPRIGAGLVPGDGQLPESVRVFGGIKRGLSLAA